MARTVDYESRKRAVLASVINRYIKEVVPIASEDIASEFNLSSASIRNIFAELEAAGFLTHPYTSAGRVPTNKGYRYYVDFLLSQLELLDEEKKKILGEFKRRIARFDDALEQTSEIISALTHYAGIVSALGEENKFFYKGISFILDQPEFQDINRMRFFIRMIEGRNELLEIINRDFKEKVKIYIGEELGCPQINNCSLIVSSYLIKDRPVGRLAVFGPMRMQYNSIIPTLEYVSDILTDVLEDI
jgi:transcriptional regulator of heat shock response